MFPPCWLFGLRAYSTGATGCWGGARSWWLLGGLTPMSTPRTTTPTVFVHAVSHITLHICRRLSNTSSLVWCSLCEVIASFLSPEVHRALYASSDSGVSVSRSAVEFLRSNLQNQVCWVPLPLPHPRLGSLMWGLGSCGRTSVV